MSRCVSVIVMLIVVILNAGCRKPHRVEMADFSTADRLVVTENGLRQGATFTDPEKIQFASAFIRRYSGGNNWFDSLGPRMGPLRLDFYVGDRLLGGYSISRAFINEGGLSRDVPESEIASLMTHLALNWPR